MTRSRKFGDESSLSKYTRNQFDLDSSPSGAALSITDLDMVIHRYIVKDKATGRIMPRQHIMLVEEKSRNGDIRKTGAQYDTLSVIHQALQLACDRRRIHVVSKKGRGRVRIFYHGIHLVQYDGEEWETSRRRWWDRKPITLEQYKQLLRFEIDAYTLLPREDRDHKTIEKWMWDV